MRSAVLNRASQPIMNLAGRSRQISAAGFRHSNNPSVGTRAQWYETTGGPVDRGCWTWTWSVAAAGPMAGLDLVVSEAPNNAPVIPGNYYSAAIVVMSSRATVLRAQAQMLNSSGGNAGTTNGPATVVPANTWTMLVIEGARALSAAVSFRADVDNLSETPLWQQGDVFKVGSLGIYDGLKAFIPFDGYTPGCRFVGDVNSVNGSQSVGYPYTLESVAGVPFLDVTTSSNAAVVFASRSFPDGASLYTIGDRPVVGDAFGAAVRDNASTQRLYAIASTNVAQVAGQVAGITNQTAVNTGAMPNGRGAIAASSAPDQSLVRIRHNSSAVDYSTAVEGAPGFLTADRIAKSTVGTGRHERQVLFDRFHDATMAARVLQQLCHVALLSFAP